MLTPTCHCQQNKRLGVFNAKIPQKIPLSVAQLFFDNMTSNGPLSKVSEQPQPRLQLLLLAPPIVSIGRHNTVLTTSFKTVVKCDTHFPMSFLTSIYFWDARPHPLKNVLTPTPTLTLLLVVFLNIEAVIMSNI